jgi:deoxyribodipyrimidine photolyase-related protein
MTIGIWVLGDQLHAGQAALASADPAKSRVLLVESSSVLAQRAVHQQKLTLVWSAMRHFAVELQAQGWAVDYLETQTFTPTVQDWIRAHGIAELRLMEPADRGFRLAIDRIPLSVPLHWLPSNAFLWSREDFATWASGYKQLRMELFYREGCAARIPSGSNLMASPAP